MTRTPGCWCRRKRHGGVGAPWRRWRSSVAVVVREPADWRPPGRKGEAARALESEGEAPFIHRHEAFFNGSLILTTEKDKLREERRYTQLLNRTTVSWINNCSTPEALVSNFISAVMK